MQPTAIDHAPLLERAFADEPREGELAVEAIEGRLPAGLTGTYRLNGPGRFEAGGLRYRNWLDGDGIVLAADFGDDGVRVTQRFVATRKLDEERAQGVPLYRTFGTRFAGDRLLAGATIASPINLSVWPFAGALLAFGEQGQPYELDAATLATRGPASFGGAINAATPFSGHPKVDPRNGELVTFGVSFAAERPLLHYFRFASDGTLATRTRVPLPFPASIHDFALAPRHAVFHVAPYLLDLDAIRHGATALEALSWRPELGSRLLILERERGEAVAELACGDLYCLHQLNAWERADGRLVVDLVELERPVYADYGPLPELFVDSPPGRTVRYVIALPPSETARIESRVESAPLGTPDFPSFDRRQLGLAVEEGFLLSVSRATPGVVGRKFFDRLLRIAWASGEVRAAWDAPAGCYFAGEPAVAAGPAEERWLIAPLWDAPANRSLLAILPADERELAPVARVRLSGRAALGFHSSWQPAA